MAESAPAPAIEITAGGAGALGGGSVGIDWVAKDGNSARISIGGTAAGTHWTTRLDVDRHSVLRLAGATFRVSGIVPPGSGHRGLVSFAAAAPGEAVALPADAVVLTAADPLRFGGPDIEAMTACRVTAFEPDEHAPASAEIEWWPGAQERADADPATVRHARLTPGGQAVIAGTPMRVLAIEGKTTDHSPGIVLEVLPRGPG